MKEQSAWERPSTSGRSIVPLLCMSTGCFPMVIVSTAQPSERNSIANDQPPGDSEMPGWFVPVYVQATKAWNGIFYLHTPFGDLFLTSFEEYSSNYIKI